MLKGGKKKPPELGKQGSDNMKTVMRNNYCSSMEDALELSKTRGGEIGKDLGEGAGAV